MKKQIIIAGGLLAAAAVVGLLVTQVSAESGADATKCNISMGVTGMSCAMGCAPRVTAALEGVSGVTKATVDFDTQSAKVDAGGGVCSQDGAKSLVKALKDAGYGGSVKSIDKATTPKPAKAAGDTPS